MVSVKHVADPDPKGGIGIQLSQHSKEVLSHYYFEAIHIIVTMSVTSCNLDML